MENEAKYDNIEAYIQDTLSADERIKFEEELASNSELRKELELHKDLHGEFTSDVLDLRTKLSEITNQKSALKVVKSKKVNTLSMIWKITSLAAVLVLGIIFLPNLFQDNLKADEIYASLYEPYPMALNQRSTSENETNTTLNEAIQSYLDKNYTSSSEKFQVMYELTNDDIYLLYKANALQANGQLELAIENYDLILQSNNPKYIEQAQWFKGLALIEKGDNSQALDLFKSVNSTHYQKHKIDQILKVLQ